MEGLLIGKMKRKDIDEVLDDFSEFSLSSPARKIRRLDAELPPIMEEDEPNPATTGDVQSMGEMETNNQERALVLYRPIDDRQLVAGPGSTNHSFSLSSDLIPGFKDQLFNRFEPIKEENENLALVPWISNKLSQFEDQETLMEIEQDEEEREKEEREKVYVNNSRDESFHQHCLIPPFPVNQPVNPVMWSW